MIARIGRQAAVGILAVVLAACGATGVRPSGSGAASTGSGSPLSPASSTHVPSTTNPATTSPLTPSAPIARPSTPWSPSPTLRPSPTPILPPWQAVPRQASVSGSQWLDVTWTGSRFVTVGPALRSGGSLLESHDGIHWRSQRSGGVSGYPSRVAAGPKGVLATGRIGAENASWVSPDGETWHARTGVFPTVFHVDDVVTVRDIVATPDGWLAVGRDDPRCNVACGSDPISAVVWRSKDGLRWTRVPATRSLQGAAMNAVAATADGYVAAGTSLGHAAIWRSTDGVEWTRVPDDPMFGPPEGADDAAWVDALGVAFVNGSIAVVGMSFASGDGGAPIVVVWQSDDGIEWTPAGVEGAIGSQVFGVAATDGGFLATGPSSDQGCDSGIWTSTDGLIWGCVRGPAAMRDFSPYAAAASFDSEVVVGIGNAGPKDDLHLGAPGSIWRRALP